VRWGGVGRGYDVAAAGCCHYLRRCCRCTNRPVCSHDAPLVSLVPLRQLAASGLAQLSVPAATHPPSRPHTHARAQDLARSQRRCEDLKEAAAKLEGLLAETEGQLEAAQEKLAGAQARAEEAQQQVRRADLRRSAPSGPCCIACACSKAGSGRHRRPIAAGVRFWLPGSLAHHGRCPPHAPPQAASLTALNSGLSSELEAAQQAQLEAQQQLEAARAGQSEMQGEVGGCWHCCWRCPAGAGSRRAWRAAGPGCRCRWSSCSRGADAAPLSLLSRPSKAGRAAAGGAAAAGERAAGGGAAAGRGGGDCSGICGERPRAPALAPCSQLRPRPPAAPRATRLGAQSPSLGPHPTPGACRLRPRPAGRRAARRRGGRSLLRAGAGGWGL
jgi:hypothetical protein